MSALKKFVELIADEANVEEGARRCTGIMLVGSNVNSSWFDSLLRLTQDMGKPISQAMGEVKTTRARVQFFIDNVHSVMKHEVVSQRGTVRSNIFWDGILESVN